MRETYAGRKGVFESDASGIPDVYWGLLVGQLVGQHQHVTGLEGVLDQDKPILGGHT